jgi:hypothetical protein
MPQCMPATILPEHYRSADWLQPVGAGWTVTPSVRYYSQSAANFYAPYFTTIQSTNVDPVTFMPIYSKTLPDYYSSDQRLAGFGALSGGVIVAKQFAKGVSLQAGFEYYTHQGKLSLSGGGDPAFNNFDYWTANAALKINLGALHFGGGSDTNNSPHHHASHAITPAGVMFNHALGKAGDMMAGYRYMRSEQGGQILNGSSPVSTDVVQAQACDSASSGCMMAPTTMTMNMHMLDLMYAPADWLTLMLMPQWVTMEMNMDNSLQNPFAHGMHMYGGGAMDLTNQQSGGVGDTGLYVLFKLFEQPGHQVVLSFGGTAPTGDVAVMQRKNNAATPDVPVDYSMQLGSGTWDLKPSLTYSGTLAGFAWGAQATRHQTSGKPQQRRLRVGRYFPE